VGYEVSDAGEAVDVAPAKLLSGAHSAYNRRFHSVHASRT